MSQLLQIEMPNGKVIGGNTKIDFNFGGALSTSEVWLTRSIVALCLILTIYCVFSKMLEKQMTEKEKEISSATTKQNTQISLAASDESSINAKTEKYESLIVDLTRTNQKISDIAARRNSIPNLLNQIMYNIPDKVQLASIENTKDRSISIAAQSTDYDQLGIFIGVIRTKKILKNVTSTSGVKTGEIVSVTIEGELP